MRRTLLCGVAALLCGVSSSWANGYRILCLKDVEASSMGDAVIAGVSGASAVAMNPAGLARTDGTEASVGVALCNAYSTRTSPDGSKSRNDSVWQAVPSFYAASDAGFEEAGFGVGVSLPNGLSSDWPEDGFARYVSTYSSLTVVDITPAMGVRLGKCLIVGAGVDCYYSEARLERMLDMGLASGSPGAMDVKSSLKGSGTAWGFNCGLIYEINAKHSIAATYRNPFTVDYDGTMSVAGNAMGIKTSVDFPATVVAGYSFKPDDKWTIEVDADWTDWRPVGDITVRFDNAALPDATQEQNFGNTIAWKAGAEYKWSESLALRGGYIYNENATPSANWRPSLPDSNNHFLTAGIGYTRNRITVDLAVQVILYEERRIDNNVDMNESVSSSSVDGEYWTWSPVAGFATTYKF